MDELLNKINTNLTNLNLNLNSILNRLVLVEKKVDDLAIQQTNSSIDVSYIQQAIVELKQDLVNVGKQNKFEVY